MKKYLVFIILVLMVGCASKKRHNTNFDTGSSKYGAGVGFNNKDSFGNLGISESDLDYQRQQRYGSGSIPVAEAEGLFKDINFGYDSSIIDSQEKAKLEQNIEILKSNPLIKVQLEGHCDERGTNEYNFALGARRAQSVYDLITSYGISADRLETISYGEELPLDSGSGEAAFSKNRRVHFSPYTN